MQTQVASSLLFVAKRSVNQIALSSDLWIRRGAQRSPGRVQADVRTLAHARGEVKRAPEPQVGGGSGVAP